MVSRSSAPPPAAAPLDSDLPWLHEPLARTLATQRSHALLVSGPAGVGQFAFALALAKAWLCETPAEARADGLACGHCGSCHLVDERSHPDLRLLVPEALRAEAGLDEAEAGGDSDGEGRKRKPSQEIKVEQVRAAIGFAELTAGRARSKVLVLHPAEALNTVAANALLKTLEEPPGALRFVLASAAPQALLPTIRSRCQSVVLARPARAPALAWLQAQGVDDAELLLAASGEQPLQALVMRQTGLDGATWRAIPQRVAAGELAAFAGWSPAQLIEVLQKLCHDRLQLSVGAAPRYFPGVALARGDIGRLTAWAASLRRQARHADHPFNAPLALEALLLEARRVDGAASHQPPAEPPSRRPGMAGPIHSRA